MCAHGAADGGAGAAEVGRSGDDDMGVVEAARAAKASASFAVIQS
jgi:hypothetical protein